MSKISVVYWTHSGNTQVMAEAIGRGIAEAGSEAEVVEVSGVSESELRDAKVFALGCPACGAEVLEEMEMEPLVETVETFAEGKSIVLFGSYGWGGGAWMEIWEERMRAAGAEILGGGGLICQGEPDEDILTQCEAIGKQMAEI